MSRDIEDRLAMFMGSRFESFTFKRIALTMDQIEEVGAPPNPAKVTDARFEAYAAEYGHESWELDALEPTYIAELITDEVKNFRNERAWDRELAREEEMKDEMLDFANRWEEEHDE